MALLEANEVVAGYGATMVLHGTNVMVDRGEVITNEVENQTVRDQLAGVHVSLGPLAQFRTFSPSGSEEVSRGHVLRTHSIGQAYGLCAFAHARRPQENDNHDISGRRYM